MTSPIAPEADTCPLDGGRPSWRPLSAPARWLSRPGVQSRSALLTARLGGPETRRTALRTPVRVDRRRRRGGLRVPALGAAVGAARGGLLPHPRRAVRDDAPRGPRRRGRQGGVPR